MNSKKRKIATITLALNLALNPCFFTGVKADGSPQILNSGDAKGFDTSDKNLGGANVGTGIGSATGDASLDNSGNTVCPDTRLISEKLISTTCWTCLFPMITLGIPVSIGGDDSNLPDGRSKKIVCMCKDTNGMPYFGFLYGLWQPSKLFELVRDPGCMAVLNGTELGFSKTAFGTSESLSDENSSKGIFMHYHYYAYPLLVLLNMMQNTPNCLKEKFLDVDVLFFSEVDPTWSDDSIAFFTNLEVVIFNNPVSLLACIPDALSATFLNRPIDSLFWCAGAWGNMYPFTGHLGSGQYDGVRGSSLMMVKAISALHRRGFLMITYGDDALCEGNYTPKMPKGQYKFTMVYPVAETKSSHVTGESTLKWGLARKVPATGEDFIYLIWNWTDCCLTIFSDSNS